MLQQIEQKFLFVVFGLCCFYEVQSNIYIVYPLSEGSINSSKPTFASRKLDSDTNLSYQNIGNETDLHIVYPVSEELDIMTPTPMKDYDVLQPEGATLIMTTTDIPNESTEYFELDNLETTTVNENTAIPDMDSTTNSVTTEIPTITPTSQNVPVVYDTADTGPIKLLKKRMDVFKLPYRKRGYGHGSHKQNSTTKIPLTKTLKAKYNRRNKNTTSTETPTISSSIQIDEKASGIKERRRYTFRRRANIKKMEIKQITSTSNAYSRKN